MGHEDETTRFWQLCDIGTDECLLDELQATFGHTTLWPATTDCTLCGADRAGACQFGGAVPTRSLPPAGLYKRRVPYYGLPYYGGRRD